MTNDHGGFVTATEAVGRLVAAAGKVLEYSRGRHQHDCIGPLSDVRCKCGHTDLVFALRAYERAVKDEAIAAGDIQPWTPRPCGRCCWPEDCEEGCVKADG